MYLVVLGVRHLPDRAVIPGLIVETEAYSPGDPACNAYGCPTPRIKAMFEPADIALIYLALVSWELSGCI